MRRIKKEVIQFLENQGYVVVSTIDEKGFPHTSCKGIVKIDSIGRIYLFDLYREKTHRNLMRERRISITAVDEHKFKGYCLKGQAEVTTEDKIEASLMKAWEERVTSRLTQRLLKNIHEEKGHSRHPEILLPNPEYLIVIDVEEIVDLTPQHLK